ncbi:MAG: glycine/betaine/sarcosine/D-proline family reductase selenoprotein B, partial [Synergistaceae bacterium]|nr:glycine/betaine/sarcosine/D-proline family reductase selenoprotein B [Synergistaceae bacterium]
MKMIKVVHYINQFYAGIGGEEKADYAPELKKGEVVGPGMAFKAAFGDKAEIIATIVCGDSYFAEHMDEAKAQIVAWVKELQPDVFMAGPAFNAGRYGTAAGAICEAVQAQLNIPVFTG